jgi:hypothetical protein
LPLNLKDLKEGSSFSSEKLLRGIFPNGREELLGVVGAGARAARNPKVRVRLSDCGIAEIASKRSAMHLFRNWWVDFKVLKMLN